MTFRVGEYQAIEVVGRPGAGQLFQGVRIADRFPVALKVLPAADLPVLHQEVALVAPIGHQHLPAVLEVVVDGDRAALVTELAAAGSLADLLEMRDRLGEGEVLTVLLPLAGLLAIAHEAEVVHGNISVDAIVFDAAGRPLLTDLGACTAAQAAGIPFHPAAADAAPERARGTVPTAAGDMFSLGSVALRCLTGRPAWPAEDLRDVLIQSTAGQWPDPGDAVSDPVLSRAIRSLLDPSPDRRPTAAALMSALRSAATAPAPVRFSVPGDADSDDVAPRIGVDSGDVSAPEENELADLDAVDNRPARGPAARRDPVARVPPHRRVGRATSTQPPDGRRSSPDAARHRRVLTPPAASPSPGGGAEPGRWHNATGARGAIGARGALGAMFGDRLSGRSPATESDAGERKRRWARAAILVLGCVVLVAVAVQGGLWWAGWDRPSPSTAGPASPAPASSVTVRTAPSNSRVTRPTPPPSPATSTTGRSRSSPTSAISSRSVGTTSSARAAAQTNWVTVVRGLDVIRGRALTNRDPHLLDEVYVPGSAARAADLAVIRQLSTAGYRVAGAAHRVISAQWLANTPDGARVSVTDVLPAYSISDAGGGSVGMTAARGAAKRILVLVQTAAGYRIGDVES